MKAKSGWKRIGQRIAAVIASAALMAGAAALPAGAAISVLGYYVAEALIFGNWVAPMASMWGNLVQALGSSVIYLAAALALDRTGIKARLQSASAGTR